MNPLQRVDHCSGNKGGSQIEEWPDRADDQNTSLNDSKAKKKISFAVFLATRVYNTDATYEASKSYSSSERNVFRTEAISEGLRIRRLISSCHLPTGHAIQQLLLHHSLTSEELLGIEHLVGLKKGARTSDEKRSYRNLVLGLQSEMQNKNERSVDYLAAAAIMRSAGNVKKARLRAVLAIY